MFLVFPLFSGRESNPKVGGWILDFAKGVLAQIGAGGACGEKNPIND